MSLSPKIEAFVPVLRIFSAFSFVAGLFLVLFPGVVIGILGGGQTDSFLIFRWFGSLVMACGLTAWLASANPARHWPIWVGGLIALGLLFFTSMLALISGDDPLRAKIATILVAILWGVPVARICNLIARSSAGGEALPPLPKDLDLEKYQTQTGETLAELSGQKPILLILLRHLGCTFCRETLADIAAQRREIEDAGAQIVFVHMGQDQSTRYLFERYRLDDIPRISDPGASLYKALGLERASFMQIYGPGMWRYTVQSILLDGHGMGQIVGDRFQMPGAFLLKDGHFVGGFRHQRISDHPDYLGMVRVASPSEEMSY